MKEIVCRALDGSDPLGFMAGVGLLRVVSRGDPTATVRWEQDGPWMPVLVTTEVNLVGRVMSDLERWRSGHAALDFAVDADQKIEDLKHPPERFRRLMRSVRSDDEAESFVTAFATGVAVDGGGKQTKPTALHFTAGRQRFMAAVISILDALSEDDLQEALFGPWQGREGPSDTRWRAGSERSRALLAFDPGGAKTTPVVGAVWLAFQAMPLLPTAPVGARIITTGFEGRGRGQSFTWPLWTVELVLDEVRALLQMTRVSELEVEHRVARGIGAVFRSMVTRSNQGYGNFAPARPV